MARLLIKEFIEAHRDERDINGTRKWTQDKVAAAAGATPATIAKYFKGHGTYIDLDLVEKMARLFGVSICDLIESDTKEK
jgi:transcriptional regulator with XRE-family HTH domain